MNPSSWGYQFGVDPLDSQSILSWSPWNFQFFCIYLLGIHVSFLNFGIFPGIPTTFTLPPGMFHLHGFMDSFLVKPNAYWLIFASKSLIRLFYCFVKISESWIYVVHINVLTKNCIFCYLRQSFPSLFSIQYTLSLWYSFKIYAWPFGPSRILKVDWLSPTKSFIFSLNISFSSIFMFFIRGTSGLLGQDLLTIFPQ